MLPAVPSIHPPARPPQVWDLSAPPAANPLRSFEEHTHEVVGCVCGRAGGWLSLLPWGRQQVEACAAQGGPIRCWSGLLTCRCRPRFRPPAGLQPALEPGGAGLPAACSCRCGLPVLLEQLLCWRTRLALLLRRLGCRDASPAGTTAPAPPPPAAAPRCGATASCRAPGTTP